ncbi:MAG: sulfotransferase [Planctomycetota bacterium]
MSRHFLILTEQRSGSTMLVHMLREHPRVRCFGELMRRTPKWMRERGYKGQLRVLDDLDPKWRDDRYRFANGETFRDLVYATEPGYDWYGFKLHLGQGDGYVERAIGRPEEKLILLRRENLLAQFSSELIAQATGQGNANASTGEVKKARVDFVARDFDKHIKQSDARWSRLTEGIRSAGRDSVYLSYLDAVSGDGVGRALAYLGLEAASGLESNTVKRNTSRIVERFTNVDDVVSHLYRIGRPEWAEEGQDAAVGAEA